MLTVYEAERRAHSGSPNSIFMHVRMLFCLGPLIPGVLYEVPSNLLGRVALSVITSSLDDRLLSVQNVCVSHQRMNSSVFRPDD